MAHSALESSETLLSEVEVLAIRSHIADLCSGAGYSADTSIVSVQPFVLGLWEMLCCIGKYWCMMHGWPRISIHERLSIVSLFSSHSLRFMLANYVVWTRFAQDIKQTTNTI